MVRAYNSNDFSDVMAWHEARDIRLIEPKALPMCGFIEPGVAAGFLYRTDSTVGFVGNYISNPKAMMRERSKALKTIAIALVECAPMIGIEQLVVLSKERSIKRIAKNLGLACVGEFSMFGKEFC